MRFMKYFLLAALLPMVSAAAIESFESAPAGAMTEWKCAPGIWKAEAGSAEIVQGHSKSGRQALRVGKDVTLSLAEPAAAGSMLSFHAERWTKREPFAFVIEAREGNDWKAIQDAGHVTPGGFNTMVSVALPAGTREVRFRVTAPADGGVMIDDVGLVLPGPARVAAVETSRAVCPVFIRQEYNPALGFRIDVEGTEGEVAFEGLEIGFEGTTDMKDIASFRVVAGGANPAEKPGDVIAESKAIAGKVALRVNRKLAPGAHWFRVSPVIRETTPLDHRIGVSLLRVKVGGKVIEPADLQPVSQRVGYAVRLPGDDDSKSYRIPGLVRTKRGTLLAVYDIRYRHAGDLPADIDVGVSRSTDGGQSWEKMREAIDMGNDPKHGFDGVGDPAILMDEKSGRIWIVALWSHGNRGWNGSGPGMKPEETGQLVLVHSDDDGKTWSKPRNITEQVKQPDMRLFFNGPGAGITMKDGTLVFAAQYRAANGTPWSTTIFSKDRGETWQAGGGVKSDTTEAQVAELSDGSLMINCRDNRGGARTIAVSHDFGVTWSLHPTDRKALREPVCMASILRWDSRLWFSNPNNTKSREAMTVKWSDDDGVTWPEENALLYDARKCFGYSCLAPVDDGNLGVLYEGENALYFLKLSAKEFRR